MDFIIPILFWGVIIVGVLIVVFGSWFTVEQQKASVITMFGKYQRTEGAGLHFKIPLFEDVASTVSLQTEQMLVNVETKTKDNVFVTLKLAVQTAIMPDKVALAVFKVNKPLEIIESNIANVVRAKVPAMTLDEVFEKKDDVANEVEKLLETITPGFGYQVFKTLVTHVEPDAGVMRAMNEINANQRLQEAAKAKGEANKVIIVKAAEAEAESKALQGQGIANQRKAIVEGLKDSIGEFQKSVPGASAEDVMRLVMMTQYFDTLKEIGQGGKVVYLPHSPAGLKNIEDQLRDAIMVGGEAK